MALVLGILFFCPPLREGQAWYNIHNHCSARHIIRHRHTLQAETRQPQPVRRARRKTFRSFRFSVSLLLAGRQCRVLVKKHKNDLTMLSFVFNFLHLLAYGMYVSPRHAVCCCFQEVTHLPIDTHLYTLGATDLFVIGPPTLPPESQPPLYVQMFKTTQISMYK